MNKRDVDRLLALEKTFGDETVAKNSITVFLTDEIIKIKVTLLPNFCQ